MVNDDNPADAILWTYFRRLSIREEALESLRRIDPFFRNYRTAEDFLTQFEQETQDQI